MVLRFIDSPAQADALMPHYQGSIPAALAAFGFIYEREVAWGDMDAMNHVNNTRYLHFCESARIEFLRTQSSWMAEQSPSELVAEGAALAEVWCRFKAPVVYPDTLLIGLGIQSVQETSFEIVHHLYSMKMQKVAAISTATLVLYDFKAMRRMPISEAHRPFLQKFAVDLER